MKPREEKMLHPSEIKDIRRDGTADRDAHTRVSQQSKQLTLSKLKVQLSNFSDCFVPWAPVVEI